MFLVTTGVFLWWSGGPRPRKRLFGGWRLGWRRWTWTLHQGTGVSSALFVVIVAFTGSYLIWTGPFVRAVETLWPRTRPSHTPPHAADTPLLSIDELAKSAARSLPGVPLHRLEIVDRPDSTVRVTLNHGDIRAFHLGSTVFLDPTTGEVLQTVRLANRPAGDSILGWFAALHMGVFAGLSGTPSVGVPVLSRADRRLGQVESCHATRNDTA